MNPESKWTTNTVGDLVQSAIECRNNDYRKQAIVYGASTIVFWDILPTELLKELNILHDKYTTRTGEMDGEDLEDWLDKQLISLEGKFPRSGGYP